MLKAWKPAIGFGSVNFSSEGRSRHIAEARVENVNAAFAVCGV